MNSNAYVATFILLFLEHVAGCLPKNTPSGKEQPSTEQPDDHDSEGTEGVPCVSEKFNHQCQQRYQNCSLQMSISNIPPQAWLKTTRFIIKEEKIDNNAKICCGNSSNATSDAKTTHDWRADFFNTVIDKINSFFNFGSKKHVHNLTIIVANETFKENEEHAIPQYYNENQNVSFSCEHINKTKNIGLGKINTTSNIIKTYETNSTHELFNKTQNGTILCCVYYEVDEKEEDMCFTRHVVNKTLLLYNNNVQQDALGDKEINLSTGTDSTADPGNHTIIIIIITAVAVLLLLLVTIVFCRKRSKPKPEPDTKVLYADLALLRQMKPDNLSRPGPEQESPYAEIIGVIRPEPQTK